MKFWQRRGKDPVWALSWATVFTVLPILICFTFAFRGNIFSGRAYEPAFLRLFQWDSNHYQSIVEEGYHLAPEPLLSSDVHLNHANVGFFPAYPLLVRCLQFCLNIRTHYALILTAQLFCFLFWFQFFLLLREWQLPRNRILYIGLNVALFPSAFFLVVGYSESLFLASLIGMIQAIELIEKRLTGSQVRSNIWQLTYIVYATMAGMLLTATRLVGVPLMAYPVLRVRRPILGLGLAILISFGGLGFFTWCYLEFGYWDIYLRLQQLGWGNQPNYFAILDFRSYSPKFFFEDTTTSLCRLSNLIILLFFGVLIRKEILLLGNEPYSIRKILPKKGFLLGKWILSKKEILLEKGATSARVILPERGAHSLQDRLGIYFAAAAIFYISLAGKANYSMDSMIRYNLPVWILLWLSYAQVTAPNPSLHPRLNSRQKWQLGLIVAGVQLWMIHIFTKGGWVA